MQMIIKIVVYLVFCPSKKRLLTDRARIDLVTWSISFNIDSEGNRIANISVFCITESSLFLIFHRFTNFLVPCNQFVFNCQWIVTCDQSLFVQTRLYSSALRLYSVVNSPSRLASKDSPAHHFELLLFRSSKTISLLGRLPFVTLSERAFRPVLADQIKDVEHIISKALLQIKCVFFQ